jgi:hypothetical protein
MDLFPNIHVHTQSDKNTIEYAKFMWETMRALANHPGALKLSVHCIGPTATDRLALLPATATYHVPNTSNNDQGLVGSYGHGACVEHALAMVDDGDIHIIVDSDAVVLAKGWDDYVRCELLDKRVGTIGTAYEEIGGVSSGNSLAQTYKSIPNVMWMALSPLHRWKDLKALPRKEDELHITSDILSRTYNLPIGYQVFRDVGWQIPEYLLQRGITCSAWKLLKPGRGAVVLAGLSDYHEEYHVTADSVPFIAHHRGSMKHAYRGDDMSKAFYATIDAYIAQEMQRPTRWLWQPRPENHEALSVLHSLKAATSALTVEVVKAEINATIEPWLKATMNGRGVWSRYAAVPDPVVVNDWDLKVMNNLRLEGTVANVHIVLPSMADNDDDQYVITIRNMTAGAAAVNVTDGRFGLEVPSGACWAVLVDVDGPVHVQ